MEEISATNPSNCKFYVARSCGHASFPLVSIHLFIKQIIVHTFIISGIVNLNLKLIDIHDTILIFCMHKNIFVIVFCSWPLYIIIWFNVDIFGFLCKFVH